MSVSVVESVRLPQLSPDASEADQALWAALYKQFREVHQRLWALETTLSVAPSLTSTKVIVGQLGVWTNTPPTGFVPTDQSAIYSTGTATFSLTGRSIPGGDQGVLSLSARYAQGGTINVTDLSQRLSLQAGANNGFVVLGRESSVTTSLSFANSASAFLTSFKAGNAVAARTYTWPTDFGAPGQSIIDAAGNGTLSWGSPAAGAPALTDTYIGYGSGANVLTGDAALTWTLGTNGGVHQTITQDGATASTVTNASAGTAAQTIVQAVGDVANIAIRTHGSGRVATRYGITLGSYSEISAGAGNGLLIGTVTAATPIVFGTNSLQRMRISSLGSATFEGMAQNNMSPAEDVTIAAGYFSKVGSAFEMAVGKVLDILAGAELEIA